MSPLGGGGLPLRGARVRAREGPAVGRDGSGGSRKRKKEMPGGLRSLRHVIRSGPARAFPAGAPPLGPHFPSPPPALAAREEPRRGRRGHPGPQLPRPGNCGCWLRAACSAPWPPAAAPGRLPSYSWVMPHEHLHRVTFRSRLLSIPCTFLTLDSSLFRLRFP